ncbi:transport-related membrane protein [Jeongeupia sp. HS-3]|uniref:GumC family protein n=1 Tax=Jeongeupia sp. HS-3 TaxID=1009682 RepID=UPI0018A4D937|nr:Wzz/FepE/Etk N-terminal domain-containing protein [Jeongeupia sp. HS-3]BCL76537.1 transport-related membrane protein [Jeongeupia sp. HS-3]
MSQLADLPINERERLAPQEREFDFFDLLIVLAKAKRILVLIPLFFTLLGLAYALLATPVYQAKTTILPPKEQGGSSALLAQLGGMAGGLGGLAAGAASLKDPNAIYIGMLESRRVREPILKQFKLQQQYKQHFSDDALEALKKRTQIVSGKDGFITISIQDESPAQAAAMANAYVGQLRNLMTLLAVTEAAQRRQYFEVEFKDVKTKLAEAEVSLKQLQERTGVVKLDEQSRATVDSLSELKAQVAAREVQLASMRNYATGENPQVKQLETEVASLRAKLVSYTRGQDVDGVLITKAKVPGASLEYVRKLRDVKYNEVLFEALARQVEMAKLDESKQSNIQVVDVATPPQKRISPKRGLIVLMALVLGLFVAVLAAFIIDFKRKVMADPQAKLRSKMLSEAWRPART